MRVLPLGIVALAALLALRIADTRGLFTAQAEEPAAKAEAAHETPADAAAPADADAHGEEVAACSPTASESDVLERLADRRKQIDQRERDLDMREKLIAAAEKRVEERVAELKTLQSGIEDMFGKRTEQEEQQITNLVKMYETMKPVAAAQIFNDLEQGVLLDVMARMKPAKAAPILAAMKPQRAQEVTVELARRYDIPAEAGALDPKSAGAPSEAASPAADPAAAAPPGG